MSKKTRMRLLSLFLLLGVLTGVLATPESQSAHATICCEHCYLVEEDCRIRSDRGPCYGEYWCCVNQGTLCMTTCEVC